MATPTGEDLERARKFVAANRWQAAKSQPWNPHEYTIRDWPRDGGTDEFDWFVDLIYRAGWTGEWGPRGDWPYLDLDGQTYFTFGYPAGETTVLNRKDSAAVDGDRDTEPWGDHPPVGVITRDDKRRKLLGSTDA